MRSFFYEENVIYWINKIIHKRGYNMKQEFAVIGLGRFGGSICRELSMEGMNVLAIDRDEDKINEFKNTATYAVIADATDEMTLKELGINNIDHVIVAIGDNIQASILTTVILTELDIKKITVKAQNDYHEKIRSEEHTSELQSRGHLVCRLLLEKIIKY